MQELVSRRMQWQLGPLRQETLSSVALGDDHQASGDANEPLAKKQSPQCIMRYSVFRYDWIGNCCGTVVAAASLAVPLLWI